MRPSGQGRAHAWAALGLAGALLLAGGSVASAYTPPFEKYHGQHGHYLFTVPEATCRYKGSGPFKLTSFVIPPPAVWWPDTVSGKHHQHGPVGWRAIVQQTSDPETGPWTLTTRSPVQKATAYEDQDALYGAGTKAPFTKRTISWDHPGNLTYRVLIQAFWYHHDGTARGWVKHWAGNHRWKLPSGSGDGYLYCLNKPSVV